MHYLEHTNFTENLSTAERVAEIHHNVEQSQEALENLLSAHHLPQKCSITAATKTRTVSEILAAIDAGIVSIAENRPQEIQIKAPLIMQAMIERGATIDMRLIGQLQTNKINKVLPWTTTIESVDSFSLAENISKRYRPELFAPELFHSVENQNIVCDVLQKSPSFIDIFLQVNISHEISKSGCQEAEVLTIAQQIGELPNVRLRGLMAVGLKSSEEQLVRAGFARLRDLRDQLLALGEPSLQHCCELSMGMSSDWRWAVLEGATEIRLGTSIFGMRNFR